MTKFRNLLFLSIFSTFAGCDPNTKNDAAASNQIIGFWYNNALGPSEEAFRFKEDGTYEWWQAPQRSEGSWVIKGGALTIGSEGTKQVDVTSDSLIWGRELFLRATEFSAKNSTYTRAITGAWNEEGDAILGGFEFNEDGSFREWFSDYQERGKWTVEGYNLTMNYDDGNEKWNLIRLDGDTLYLGLTFYTKNNAKSSNTSLTPTQQLVGTWFTKDVGDGQTFEFRLGGTYRSKVGDYASSGKWEIVGNKIILDGFEKYSENFTIKNGQLTWGGTKFVRRD